MGDTIFVFHVGSGNERLAWGGHQALTMRGLGFSPPLRLLVAMRAFYELSRWITPSLGSGTQTCNAAC